MYIGSPRARADIHVRWATAHVRPHFTPNAHVLSVGEPDRVGLDGEVEDAGAVNITDANRELS